MRVNAEASVTEQDTNQDTRWDAEELLAVLTAQRDDFHANLPVSAETRVDRLNRVIALLLADQDAIVQAIHADFGGRSLHQTRMSDLYATLETLKYARDHVAEFMKPEKRRVNTPLALFGARARVEYQPKGVVGILGTWNFPVNTVLSPLASVLAAGNRALLKFSELTPRTAALMAEKLAARFDQKELACIEGGPEVGAAFAELPLDHLVFTGSGATGRLVMRAAATHLTPVTLELGGKSPVIVAPDADVAGAAQRIMEGKALNAGQACLAPDVIWVLRGQRETFIAHALRTAERMFPTLRNNHDLTNIVNARHADRLRGYIRDARAAGADIVEVNPTGERLDVAGERRLPFTFVVDPDPALAISQEEIFGPFMVIRTYRKLTDVWQQLQAGPRPLGLYVFTHDAGTQRAALDQTHSGGVTFNDVLLHASQDDLPFGGIGPSGMGRYRGIDGFREFSHPRAVFHASRVPLQRLSGLVPPFGRRADETLARILRG